MKFIRLKQFIKKHKTLTRILIVLGVIFIAICIYVGIGLVHIKSTITKLQQDASLIKTGQSNKSFDQMSAGLTKAQPDIVTLQSNIQYFRPLGVLPIFGGYYQNAIHIANALAPLDQGGVKMLNGLVPVANAFGYGPNPIQGSSKISAFVHALPTVTQALDLARTDFKNAQNELDLVDPTYIPSIRVKGASLHATFLTYNSAFNNFVNFIPKIDTLAPVIQRALGDPIPQNYLLLFQNDKEIRPTGGFISIYGYLSFDKGNLGDIHTNDIFELSQYEDLGTKKFTAPAQLQQYNAASTWYIRDENTSPDISTTAKQIEKSYNNIPAYKRTPIDGIVFIDTQFVADLLRQVGSIYIPEYNVTITPDNLALTLECSSESSNTASYAELCGHIVNFDNANIANRNRKKLVNYLLPGIKGKVFGAQKDQLLNLISAAANDFGQKHVAIYADNANLENTLNQYAWDGSFPTYTNQDFFGLVEANLGGAKANFYVKRTIDTKTEKTTQGYKDTVNITFTNNQVYDGWLNGPYKAWIRMYVPQGAQLLSIKGTDGYYAGERTFRTYTDLGYTVFDDHITLPAKLTKNAPASTVTVTLQYMLPANLTFANGYSMYVYKQAGLTDMNVSVTYNGKKQTADIMADKNFSF